MHWLHLPVLLFTAVYNRSPVNISNNNKSTSRRHSCFSCLCICCLFSDIIIIFFFMCRFWLICCLSFFLKLKNANALISSRSVLLSFFWMATFWWFCAERVPARKLLFFVFLFAHLLCSGALTLKSSFFDFNFYNVNTNKSMNKNERTGLSKTKSKSKRKFFCAISLQNWQLYPILLATTIILCA